MVILKGLLCLYLTGSFLLVLYLYLIDTLLLIRGGLNYSISKILINPVRDREIIGVFNNCKFVNRLQYKKCLKQHFSDAFLHQMLLFTLQYRGLTFYVIDRVFHLKPKESNVANISAFALFFVRYIHLWTVNWMDGPFLIILKDPGIILASLFQSATGT